MKTEKDLAEELGVDRNILRAWRTEGEVDDWEKRGNSICYNSDGEHKVRNLLQKQICVEELSAPLDPEEPQDMKITKIPLNPNLVICGDQYVRVKSNKNFLTGMSVKARPPATGGRVWVMLGRCPRWRGRY